MPRPPRMLAAVFVVTAIVFAVAARPSGQSSPAFVGLGDSIGEGVQSADASVRTQPFSYLHIIALLAGAPFPQPYIQSGLFGAVGDVSGRTRLDPSVEGLNLAVSGANTADLLFARADAFSTDQIDSEIDLVLFPRRASQIEIVESLRPQLVACWIGNNDALGAVTDSGQLDGVSNLTPLPVFTSQFTEVAARLAALGSKVVFGTIPDVTKIGFLLDRADLIRVTGSDYGLPAGSWTTLSTAMALRLGILPSSALSEPNLVLNPSEAASINRRIDEFNDVIRANATLHGMGVADIAAVFDGIAANPPVLFGVPITTRFLGGLFSLDGVHPSNLGHVIAAKLFVETFNRQYGLNIPEVGTQMLGEFFFADPFIDKDGDGRVVGRVGAGLLESAAVFLGWSGDSDDSIPMPTATTQSAAGLDTLMAAAGEDLTSPDPRTRLRAMDRLIVGAIGHHRRSRR